MLWMQGHLSQYLDSLRATLAPLLTLGVSTQVVGLGLTLLVISLITTLFLSIIIGTSQSLPTWDTPLSCLVRSFKNDSQEMAL